IEGTVPLAMNLPDACGFYDRCDARIEGLCDRKDPELVAIEPGHKIACFACQNAACQAYRAKVEEELKAKEGKADAIENAFKNAKEMLAENNNQYPQNLAKISAAKVLRNGDYVCFMLLGKPNESGENDESAAQFAEDQVNIGVKEFQNFFENVKQ
ncbi:MAG: DUF4358 domain-containing protein, partial [Ruminiclostridium sp.]|nr:DUF4358 domain-containing protein [Ruminiclostridium sp.]